MNDYYLLQPWLYALRQRLLLLLAGLLLAVLTAVSGVALLGVSGWFITAAAVLAGAFNIFTPGAAIRLFAVLRTVARYFERVVNHDLILRIQQRWRVRLFGGLLMQPLTTIERFKLAHVLQRLTQDLNTLDDLYIRILAPLGLLVTVSFGVGLVLYWLTPALGLLVWALAAILIVVHCFVLAPRLRQQAGAELQLSERLRHQTLALMHSKAELHAWGALPTAINNVTTAVADLTAAQRKLRRQLWCLQQGVELIGMLAVIAGLVIALHSALAGAFSVPWAILAGLALLGMQELWTTLPQAALLWGKVTGAAQRLQPMLPATSHKQAQPSPPPEFIHQAPSIALGQVRFNQRTLPKAVTLQFIEGQITRLVGPSGSGKTSILLGLAGLLGVDSGTIQVRVEGASASLQQVPTVMLTQDNAILAQTVAVNLRMGKADISDAQLWDMLELVELADVIKTLPEQLATWLGDGGVQLSGGQQRRLALARTCLHAQWAQLVLLDEPFNGIGGAQATRIWHRIQAQFSDKTVILVSHQSLSTNRVQQHL